VIDRIRWRLAQTARVEGRRSTMTRTGLPLSVVQHAVLGRASRVSLSTALRAAMAVALVVLLSPAGSSAALGSPTTFADPAGDTSGSPDITEVGVAHTVARGLTITVSVGNEPMLLTGHIVELRLDTDMNASTGSPNGVERLIHRLWTGQTLLCTWTGASFSCTTSSAVSSTYVDGLLRVTTTTQALGICAGFDFSVAGFGGSPPDRLRTQLRHVALPARPGELVVVWLTQIGDRRVSDEQPGVRASRLSYCGQTPGRPGFPHVAGQRKIGVRPALRSHNHPAEGLPPPKLASRVPSAL